MSTNAKLGGSWQEIKSAWAKLAGSWEQAVSIWVKASGNWHLVFSGVTVSGHTVSADNAGADAVAYLKFDQDGNVYKKENTAPYSQIDASTDWVRPVAAAPGNYYIRFTGATGDTGDLTSTVPEDTWHPLATSDFIIWIIDTTTILGGKSASFTIEIKNGTGGATLDSASYTLSADREDA